ncbi:hypothetical protein [Shewanella sp. MM_2022_3]|uniref:hypothetical protein n=1 Tax=Shewanella sp. MM_2022_3 TaxID=2923280 RepID=UPI001F4BE22D|nr:hypothetical protein [Shewanella sp. MM_2022_3]MCH7421308.1 hypothetical protein [Shewanella sp. MM_2022_3]
MSGLNIDAKAYGKFKLIITHSDGRKVESAEFSNLLLNNAFSNTSATEFTYCGVGTGTTEPTVTDTALVNKIGPISSSANGSSSEIPTTWSGSVATVGRKMAYSFALGAVVGNISEIAIYNSNSSLSSILVRTLVKDTNGNPTSITLTASDQLSVEYSFFVEIETRQPAQTINIGGANYQASVIVGFPESYASSSTKEASIMPTRYPYANTTANSFFFKEVMSVPPTGTAARLDINSGNRVNLTASSTTDRSVAGVIKETISCTIPTATQLPNGASIGFCVIYTSANVANIAIAFNPPLPKNNTVGYTVSLSFSITRK